MSTDLDRELTHAGRAPSRPLDRDALLDAVQRHETGRRAAAGVAAVALALVGVAGVGLLLPEPPTSLVVGDTLGASGDDGALLDVGQTLATVEVVDGVVEVALVDPDGSTRTYRTTSAPGTGRSSDALVDGSGRVVYVDAGGALVRGDVDSTAVLAGPDEGPWSLLGTTTAGAVLVGTVGESQLEEVRVLVGSELEVPAQVPFVTDPRHEQTVIALRGERLRRATATEDRLVVSMGAGYPERWVESRVGDAVAPTVGWVHEPPAGSSGRLRLLPTFVDGDLWGIERHALASTDGPDGDAPPQDLVVRAAEADEVVLPTPVGRGIDGYVRDVTSGTLDDGRPAALLVVETPDGYVSLLVDVERARGGDADAVTRLDVTGDVRFLAG